MVLLLKRFLSARSLAGAEAVVLVILLVYAWTLHDRMRTQRAGLETARVALEHPKIVEKIRVVKIAGPTRVITKVVERPGGEKETVTDTATYGESSIWGSDTDSVPVALEAILPAAPRRTDRWLLGISNRGLTAGQWEHYGLWAGYSFRNRLDLLGGLTYGDGAESNVMAVLRF